MRILQVHNFYQQPGGEDQVYAAEFELLTAHGHSVERYALHNDAIRTMGGVTAGARTIWNRRAFSETRAIIRQFSPDVVHCHNTFPLISPSVYYAASAQRVPVVQTIHNYRLICPAATLFRDGHVCEDCVGRSVAYPAVLHACYRGSRPASLAVASMLALHRAGGTWRRRIGRYIALTNFAKQKLEQGGLPGEKISVKPNFVNEQIEAGSGSGGFALYVGRLAEEKGIRTLLMAWETITETPLRIIGDGPLRPLVQSYSERLPQIVFEGYSPRDRVLERMRSASCLVLPSEWYEGLPMTALESMACGTPVIAADIGSLREIISDDVTGARFTPGDARALASVVRRLLADPAKLNTLRRQARAHYETNYSREVNYQKLIAIYREVAVNCNV